MALIIFVGGAREREGDDCGSRRAGEMARGADAGNPEYFSIALNEPCALFFAGIEVQVAEDIAHEAASLHSERKQAVACAPVAHHQGVAEDVGAEICRAVVARKAEIFVGLYHLNFQRQRKLREVVEESESVLLDVGSSGGIVRKNVDRCAGD